MKKESWYGLCLKVMLEYWRAEYSLQFGQLGFKNICYLQKLETHII